MRTIMVLNAKGGSGKSTIATNLASYYAAEQGARVVLADFDPQGSSSEWLVARPEDRPPIAGIRAWEEDVRPPRNTDVLILDAPSRVRGKELTAMVRRAQTILIPVLPSPIDIRAAAHFIHDLLLVGKVSRKQTRVAVIANRVREHTIVYHDLERFLNSLRIPFVATLRDTQNYIKAAERGLGVFELAPSTAYQDLEQWEPLVRWLRSKRSRPQA
ncbi:MAG: AAA family ATPase [Gammaproteobacteria bacterium]|nr:AAA family ATPase [Gammaproteobacteria bacterium]NIR97754.1 AAA family ATPase [Gammaproteobacteria bacterium]NIT63464.1 AAA family ATPase [Gammaproteobacteria bacterium]NIV20396.1 AAA family ATPase [Gammaproteobacteria bacterium]NIX10914.1 AAA family ATPase [Gammaproteobacteria bacterium]